MLLHIPYVLYAVNNTFPSILLEGLQMLYMAIFVQNVVLSTLEIYDIFHPTHKLQLMAYIPKLQQHILGKANDFIYISTTYIYIKIGT